ncbi:MAG: sigma-70 family RNA polymerase sigma factor [Planctomycetaceae bacterium]
MTAETDGADDDSLRMLIDQARRGEEDALGRLLETHRGFLRGLARRAVGDRLRVRVDDSDLVQQTLASAVRNFPRFRGRDPGEFVAWLRLIHERNIQDAIRDHVASDKRTVGKEERLGDRAPETSQLADAGHSTPSGHAIRIESLAELGDMLDRLPEDQQTAIRLRHLEHWTLPRIASHMARSETAVAGLIKRGLKSMREWAAFRSGPPE